jgi:hypothetical protein
MDTLKKKKKKKREKKDKNWRVPSWSEISWEWWYISPQKNSNLLTIYNDGGHNYKSKIECSIFHVHNFQYSKFQNPKRRDSLMSFFFSTTWNEKYLAPIHTHGILIYFHMRSSQIFCLVLLLHV